MTESREKQPNAAIDHIRQQIAQIDLVCTGTITERTKVCGKPNCRCATDPKARHGPYYEWTRQENGRFVHSVVSPEQAREITRGIKNYRRIMRLLGRWRRETTRALRIRKSSKSR